MPGPTDPTILDDAIKRYLAGEAQEKILADLHISAGTLHRERRRRGVPSRRVRVLPGEEIAAAYLAGESEYSLSDRYLVSTSVIRRYLVAEEVPLRGRADAGRARAAGMTPDERKGQATAANAAVRGTKQSHEHLIARALTNEARGRQSPGEYRMARWLAFHRLEPIPQRAIGKYNVDLAIAPVAVEILGGGWHLEKRTHAHRTPEILDAGWHLVFIWNHEGISALAPAAADYVVAFLKEVRRKPPACGQYRVISGNGQLLAAGGRDDGKFALVPPPRGRARGRT